MNLIPDSVQANADAQAHAQDIGMNTAAIMTTGYIARQAPACSAVSCTLCASEPDQPAQAPQGDSTARMLALNVGTEQRSNPKKRRKLRDLAGYDPNPPVCRQCTNFRPAQEGNPASNLRPMVPYIPAHCAKHHFTTQPLAVCDDWQHKVTRETLR